MLHCPECSAKHILWLSAIERENIEFFHCLTKQPTKKIQIGSAQKILLTNWYDEDKTDTRLSRDRHCEQLHCGSYTISC